MWQLQLDRKLEKKIVRMFLLHFHFFLNVVFVTIFLTNSIYNCSFHVKTDHKTKKQYLALGFTSR